MICINKSLLSFIKLKISINAVSFPNCLQFVLAVASRFEVWICLLNGPWTAVYMIVSFVRETDRCETLVASCLLLWVFTFNNFARKWKPGEMFVNLVTVHTGSCNVGCAPGIRTSVLCAFQKEYSTPILGKHMAGLWWGPKLKWIHSLFTFSLFIFFSLSSFFLRFSLSCFLRELWDLKASETIPCFVSSCLVLVLV